MYNISEDYRKLRKITNEIFEMFNKERKRGHLEDFRLNGKIFGIVEEKYTDIATLQSFYRITVGEIGCSGYYLPRLQCSYDYDGIATSVCYGKKCHIRKDACKVLADKFVREIMSKYDMILRCIVNNVETEETLNELTED